MNRQYESNLRPAAGREKGKRLFSMAVPLILALVVTGCFTARPTERESLQREKREEAAGKIFRELPRLQPDSPLSEYVEYAVLNSPEVRAAYYDWEAAVSAIVPARYLPDVRLAFEAELRDMADDMYMAGGTLSFPAPGKRSLRAERQALMAEQKEIVLREKVLQTAFQVKRLAYNLRLVEERISYLEETLEILEEIEKILHRSAAFDRASQIDILDLQVRKENLRNEIIDQKELMGVYHRRFASAMGESLDELEFYPGELIFTEELSDEDIWTLVIENNPRLARARTSVEEGEVLVKLAYREYRPDFGMSFMRTVFSAMTVNKPMLMLSVPWRGRIKSQVEASLSKEKRAEGEYLAEELDLAVMLSEGLFRWRQADREAKLYGDRLIPKASSILEIILTRYEVDRASFSDVLDAVERKLEYRYNYSSARALREIAFNEIFLVVAGVMPEWLDYPEEDYEE